MPPQTSSTNQSDVTAGTDQKPVGRSLDKSRLKRSLLNPQDTELGKEMLPSKTDMTPGQCRSCFCFDGRVACEVQLCPAPPLGCEAQWQAGSCCPSHFICHGKVIREHMVSSVFNCKMLSALGTLE